MTVSTAYSPLQFNGNGATTAFAVTWPFFTGSLVVTAIDATGVETVKTLTTHYTVSGGTSATGLPATGTVTMLVAPASGTQLRITRVTPRTQTSTWGENDNFPQATIEAALDKNTMIAQELLASASDDITGDFLQLDTTGDTDFWDGENHKLRNIVDGTEDDDAVTVAQLNEATFGENFTSIHLSAHLDLDENAAPGTPAADTGRLYAFDSSGTTRLAYKDSAGNVRNFGGPVVTVDNTVSRYDGTAGITQGSGVVIDDSNNVSGVVNLTQTGYHDVTEIAAPSSPASNVARLYSVDDGGTTKLAYKDNAGTVTDLGYFTQSGTGAVLRGSQSRMRDTVNVLDFIPVALHAAILDHSSTSDVSSYIQLAINYANGRRVYCPAGRYCLDTAISFTQNAAAGSDTVSGLIHLEGDGHGIGPGAATTAQKFVTRFLIRFGTGDVITATTNYPCIIRGIQFNTFSAPRTSGATILISGPTGGTNNNTIIEDCGFTGCYRSIQYQRCFMPTTSKNYFVSWKQDAIHTLTTSGIEGGGGNIQGNTFFGTSGATSGTQNSCILLQTGYTYIQNNLLLGAAFGVQINAATFSMGSIHILDNFIENQGQRSITVSSSDGTTIAMLKISRNEFSNASFVSNWVASIVITDYSTGTDYLDDLEICNNVHRHTLDANHRFIWVLSGRMVSIHDEQMENLGTGSSTVGIDASTLSAGALKAPLTIKDCQFRGTFGSGRYILTPVTRLVEPEIFVTVQGSDVSLTNNITTAQNIFASANDVLTLMAATTYFFEGEFYIATGTTTHTTALGFVASSAFTSIKYTAELWSTTSGTISTTAPSILDVAVSTATVLNATSVAPFTKIRVKGLIRTNAATTMTPQITFSAGPTGTCAVKTDSWLRLAPVGSNTKVFHGDWA
jgi:hypothetical protein